jgi:hypothetical protein
MERKTLKPAAADLVVRDPVTKVRLPAAGDVITMTTYWRRRMAEGSVVEVKPEPAPKASTSKKNQD